MQIKNYLEQSHTKVSAFARQLGVTPSMVSHYIKGRKKTSPKVSAKIEQLTKGEVSRKELRPDDWHLIWPELKK